MLENIHEEPENEGLHIFWITDVFGLCFLIGTTELDFVWGSQVSF